jgi:hypothetical protein
MTSTDADRAEYRARPDSTSSENALDFK